MLPSLPSQLGRWVLALLLSLPLLLTTYTTQATHIRAGDIQATIDTTVGPGRNPRRVFFKMILYADPGGAGGGVPTDRVPVFFGDGTTREVTRRGPSVPISTDPGNRVNVNVYLFEHTYDAPGNYLVTYLDQNRVADVRNMIQSVDQTFYISTLVLIDPVLAVAGNRSPKLTAPAIDRAAVRQVFLHNPAAYDADGDSLTYELLNCQQGVRGLNGAYGNGNIPINQPCIGYVFPDNASFGGTSVPFGGNPAGGISGTGQAGLGGPDPGGNPVTCSQNRVTGQIVWNAPAQAGIYNLAFRVREYRRLNSGRARLIGEVIRDMQILVSTTPNLRPEINIPQDTCVVAGTNITRTNITATDPANQRINLYAYSGIFPPATFQQTAFTPTARGRFSWTPDCSNIAQLPTQVIFKAENQPTNVNTPRLIDEKVWRITVIGPAPTGLTATEATNRAAVNLNWDRYFCQTPGQDIRILIFRREGQYDFTPMNCQTGLPAGSGYVQVGNVTKETQAFLDDNNGQGLIRGREYCYRIYARFPLPAGGESIVSREVCVTLENSGPRMTNVTVDETSPTAGVITTRWTRPIRRGTIPAPAGYRLYRSSSANAAFAAIYTTQNLSDTTYVDRSLNTRDNTYTYRVDFFSGGLPGATGATVEASPTASSVRLNAVPNQAGTAATLTWTYSVPWNNAPQPVRIFRREVSSTNSPFVLVSATAPTGATGGTYTDNDPALVTNRTYRYYVETKGTYNVADASSPLNSLLNLSQQRDVTLVPVPCPPVLTVESRCEELAALVTNRPGPFPRDDEQYTNYLSWTLNTTAVPGCTTDVAYYRVFYTPDPDATPVLLDSTRQAGVRTYQHQGLTTQLGCYQVQAVSAAGQRSALSEVVCADNCQLFIMPNIFTPNGDGINDTFRPKVASPIRRTHFKAYNRWGVLVYESTINPLIEWAGEGTGREGTQGRKVSEGVYYYQAEVEFADRNNTQRTFKGWVQINR